MFEKGGFVSWGFNALGWAVIGAVINHVASTVETGDHVNMVVKSAQKQCASLPETSDAAECAATVFNKKTRIDEDRGRFEGGKINFLVGAHQVSLKAESVINCPDTQKACESSRLVFTVAPS